MTWLSCAVGAAICLPFAPQLVADLAVAPASAIVGLVYLAIFPTAVAFTTWAFALSRTTAGRLGSTTYLAPAIAIVLGWLVLGDVPPALAIVGGGVAITGVIIARWAPAQRPTLETATPASPAT